MNADDDQSAREVMWKSGYQITPLCQYLGLLNRARKVGWNAGFASNLATAIYTDANIAAIRKGPLLMVLSNEGSESAPKKILIHTTFAFGSVLTNILTGHSIAIKHSTSITIIQGQPQLYLPYPLAAQVCSNIIPPPTNYATQLLHRLCFSQATYSDNTITFWSNGLPVKRGSILKPNMLDVSSGQILKPSRASLSSPYSIFRAKPDPVISNGAFE
jgi:hypothetical protein